MLKVPAIVPAGGAERGLVIEKTGGAWYNDLLSPGKSRRRARWHSAQLSKGTEKMTDLTEKKSSRIKRYAIIIGIVYLAGQHGLYLVGHYLATWIGFEPFLPKIPFDDLIPIVSIWIIPYIWSYIYWAMGPMVVSKCEKQHFKDYLAACLLSCLAGMLLLAFFPTYMDRVAEGLYAVPENPTVFDKIRMFWYSLDGSAIAYNLLPSFHCINSTLCYLGVAGRKEIPLWFRIYSLITTLLIFASTVYVKQHYVLDIVTGAALGAIVYFLCKKFHWGRMFDPIERLWAKRKAKKAAA